MGKEEARKLKRGGNSMAGDAKREILELERLQEAGRGVDSEIVTITVECTRILSLVCC